MRNLVIITPTLGVSPWLHETVESVAALPLPILHVLVAPADRRGELAARFPGTTLVADPGGGMYAAINAGLAVVADWAAFSYLNDDDVLLPEFVRVAAAVDAQGNRPALVYGGVRLIDERGRRLGAIPISPDPRINRALYALRLEPVYQHGTMVTRAAYEKLGGFDPAFRLCGDSEYLARACVAGVPSFRATGREVAAFRLRSGQLTKNRQDMMAERARVDAKLQLVPARLTREHRIARWRFRLANAPIYAERIARHGFVSFDTLLTHAGR